MDPANIFDKNTLQGQVVMSGPRYLEDTYCRLRVDAKTTREAKISLDFVAIEQSSKAFESTLSGFIGLGPYTATDVIDLQATNFMR